MTGLRIAQARVRYSIQWAFNHKALFFHEQDPFLPTSYTQPWGLSTPGSCTFWAFEPGPSAPTPWWSSFSPYQTKARTTSEAWACLVDWTEAWTASAMKRWQRNRGAVKHWWEMRGGRSGCFEDIPRKKEKNTSYYFLCDGDYQTDYDNLTQIEENISVAPPTLKKLYKLTDKLN